MRHIKKIEHFLPLRAGWRAWCFVILPTCVSLAILLGIGPVLQQVLSGLLSDPAPTLYDTVFGEGLISSISLADWFLFAFDPATLVPAILATIFAFGARTHLQGAFRAAVAGFISISTADAFVSVFSDREVELAESLVFNAIGAGAIFVLFIAAFPASETGIDTESKNSSDEYRYSIAVVAFALLISAIANGLFNFFFFPSNSAQYLLEANYPTSGYTVASDALNDDDGGRNWRAISVFPKDNKTQKLEFTGFANETSAEWERLDQTSEFSVSIHLFANCVWVYDLSEVTPEQPVIEIQPSNLSIGLSEGLSRLITAHAGSKNYKLTSPSVTQFWFKSREDGSLEDVQAFLGVGETISVDPDTGMQFYLSGQLSDVGDGRTEPSARQFSLGIDDQQFTVSAGGLYDGGRDWGRCYEVTNAEIISQGGVNRIEIPNASSLHQLGVLVDISRVPSNDGVFQTNESALIFKNLNGWASIRGIDLEQMRGSYLGTGRGLSIDENLRRLVIDGEVVEVAATDRLTAVGDMDLSYEQDHLQAKGSAIAIWLNNRRLNKTSWERLSEGWQIAVITTFLGLLGLGAGKLIPILPCLLRRNAAIILPNSTRE